MPADVWINSKRNTASKFIQLEFRNYDEERLSPSSDGGGRFFIFSEVFLLEFPLLRSKKTCSLVRHYFGGLLVYGGGKGGKITTCARRC